MSEVEVRFEREDLEGVVAAGTYLIDAAKRLGVHFEEACDPATDVHHCSVMVTSGSELLSDETKAERRYFESIERGAGERLACQTKIERPGKLIVMTKEKKTEEPVAEAPVEAKDDQYLKEFAELPLEKQIANLVRLETIALGQTVSFIVNSPFKVGQKFLDVMAEFGFKKEEREKEAVRPEEHRSNGAADDADDVVESEAKSA